MGAHIIAEPLGCLYVATCLPTGKAYVGITIVGLEKRKRAHLKNAREGLPYHFYRAIRKHGSDQFEWAVLKDGHDWPTLCELERLEIARLRALGVKLYNMTDGGDGTKGWKATPEISAKMSASAKVRMSRPDQAEWNRQKSLGIPNSAEQRAKISAAMKGRRKSEETKARMREAQRCRANAVIWTDEMRAVMSERARKNVLSEEARIKISAKLKGVKKRPETVEKMRYTRLLQLGKAS